MIPVLVYLHIPKSAGSSQRRYLQQVYGEASVSWHGLDSAAKKFSPRNAGGSPVLGGHVPISRYPASLDALYASVVRYPAERAVSLYNYHMRVPQDAAPKWVEQREKARARWIKEGMDPDSLVRSIKNCKKFRAEIANQQCAYLSRYAPTFDGVVKTLKETSMVVGLFEQIDRFNSFFMEQLCFPFANEVRVNVGASGYSQPILQEEGVTGLLRELNLEDLALYDFIRLEHGGLYLEASNLERIAQRVPKVDELEQDATVGELEAINWRAVKLYSKGIFLIRESGGVTVHLAIRNGADVPLSFSEATDSPLALVWRALSPSGEALANLGGVARIDASVPAGEYASFPLHLSLTLEQSHQLVGNHLEVSLLYDDAPLWETHPLNSCWIGVGV